VFFKRHRAYAGFTTALLLLRGSTKELKKLVYLFVALLSVAMPLSASAALYDVTFSGAVTEYADENGDFFIADSDFTYFDVFVDGQFRIDTGVPESGAFPNNFPNAISQMSVQVEDFSDPFGLFDSLSLDGIVDDAGAGLLGNNVFVGDASSDNLASVYIQDFFVGNVDLSLLSAGDDFANDIGVFDLAAATDPFDVFFLGDFFGGGSTGSFQTLNGEYFFDVQDMTVTLVPVPAAVWLFVSGLLSLGAVARRRS